MSEGSPFGLRMRRGRGREYKPSWSYPVFEGSGVGSDTKGLGGGDRGWEGLRSELFGCL